MTDYDELDALVARLREYANEMQGADGTDPDPDPDNQTYEGAMLAAVVAITALRQERDSFRVQLAEARALLKKARPYFNSKTIRDRIDALAGKDAK